MRNTEQAKTHNNKANKATPPNMETKKQNKTQNIQNNQKRKAATKRPQKAKAKRKVRKNTKANMQQIMIWGFMQVGVVQIRVTGS